MENKPKFTSGPWKVVPRKLCGNDIQGADGIPVIEAGFKLLDDNATLISAAPEMYEALKIMVEIAESNIDGMDDHFHNCGGTIDAPGDCGLCQAREALKKAEGK